MTTKLNLSFGYNAGLPDSAIAAWGARFIVTQDGYVDFVWDRTDAVGDSSDREALFDLLECRYSLDRLRADLSEGLKTRRIGTREAAEIVFYDDDDLRVVGNSNASAGYFYVTGYRKGAA